MYLKEGGGVLCEIDHKVNIVKRESLFLLRWRCCFAFVKHFLQCLVERIDLRSAIVICQSWCSYIFLHPSYITTMIVQVGAIMYLLPYMIIAF